MVICLERGADLHMVQLMSMPLTISCFCKIHIGFTFLVPAHPDGPGKRAVKRVCVCMVRFFYKSKSGHSCAGWLFCRLHETDDEEAGTEADSSRTRTEGSCTGRPDLRDAVSVVFGTLHRQLCIIIIIIRFV